MKNALVIAISCGITWFAAKFVDNDTTEVKIVQQELHQEDSVLNKITSTHEQLNQAIESGDKKVVETIDKAANTITTLKEKVNFLQNAVKTLVHEKDSLIRVINTTSNNLGEYSLLPINKDNR